MTAPVDPMPTIKSIVYPELVHPEKIGHVAEAERFIAESVGYADPRNVTGAGLQMAQAHATLALVEQTRIANLIALGIGRESREIREGLGL